MVGLEQEVGEEENWCKKFAKEKNVKIEKIAILKLFLQLFFFEAHIKLVPAKLEMISTSANEQTHMHTYVCVCVIRVGI